MYGTVHFLKSQKLTMATASREWSTDEEEAVSEDNLFYEGYTDHSSAYPYTAVPDPVDYSREVRPRVHHAPRTPRTLPTQVRINKKCKRNSKRFNYDIRIKSRMI